MSNEDELILVGVIFGFAIGMVVTIRTTGCYKIQTEYDY